MKAAIAPLVIVLLAVVIQPLSGQERLEPGSRPARPRATENAERKTPAPAATAVPGGSIAAPAQMTDRPDDERAIRALTDAFINAYNAGDARRLAALFTPDAEMIDEFGGRLIGQEELED
jgi:hypothetical protein